MTFPTENGDSNIGTVKGFEVTTFRCLYMIRNEAYISQKRMENAVLKLKMERLLKLKRRRLRCSRSRDQRGCTICSIRAKHLLV